MLRIYLLIISCLGLLYLSQMYFSREVDQCTITEWSPLVKKVCFKKDSILGFVVYPREEGAKIVVIRILSGATEDSPFNIVPNYIPN